MATQDQFGQLSRRIQALPPERRALFLRRLEEDGGQFNLFPLSFAQERLWLTDQLEPGNPAYNLPAALRLTGELDARVLERAFGEVVRRHEMLRTSFPLINGRPFQFVGQAGPFSLPVADLRDLPAGKREREVARLAAEEARRPFDLAKGGLLRARLLKISEREHALLLTLHHIVGDAWSSNLLVRELTALYSAYARGAASPLPELAVQYADFAAWQRKSLRGEALEGLLAYWRRQLADAPPVLELPADRPRPQARSFRGGTENLFVPGATYRALQELSRREGATLFMTLLAAFKVLLARYTGQTDIVTGTPIAGRARAESEPLIGFFVNTLVLRTDLSGDPTFRELLARVRETCLGAYAHQELPFDKLVEELNPARSAGQTPLFQVMFSVQNAPKARLSLDGLTFDALELEPGTAKFDLVQNFVETDAGLAGNVHFNTDIFERETVARLLGHFLTLLEGIAAAPDRRVSSLPLLKPEERARLLHAFNETRADYPHDSTFTRLFERQAARTPESVAAVCGERRITYGQLNAGSNRLARLLVDEGVGADMVVALLAGRGIELLTSVLATFKAGGAYLPLDPKNPPRRLSQILAQSGAAVVVTTAELAAAAEQALEGLPETARPRVVVFGREDARHPGAAAGENLPARSGPGNLAYVIYTSGSTGRPKGAMIEHGGMLNHLYAKIYALGLSAADAVAETASQCFDISVWQFLSSLLVGGRVEIFDDEVAHNGARLLEAAARRGVTILESVPALVGAMLDARERRQVSARELGALRWLLVTGEALPPETCRRWFGRYDIPLMNAYGPTECSDDVTHHVIAEAPAPEALQVPIGRPVINTQLYVLDANLEPVPPGGRGELYVGGVGVGRGYLGEGARTAEVFLPNPFGAEPGSRLYKTGDAAKYLPDGTLQYLGRVDTQVKVHGFRIELGEIDAALRAHARVREAAVVAREDARGDKRLVAYVVPRVSPEAEGSGASESDARQVAQWGAVFDKVYSEDKLSERDEAVNLRVWINSYTGQPFSEAEIFECVEDTVRRILSLRPARVLEIGCGTGLILSRVAAHCEEYFGTDLSQEVLDALDGRLRDAAPALPPVRLLKREAADFSGVPAGAFDLVVINEVVQYLPSVTYLVRVIEGALEAVAPGGAIFVGGVRSLPLLEAFHASVQLRHAPDALPVEEFRRQVRKQLPREKELVVDPDFFHALRQRFPQISHVQFQLKGGAHDNELTMFRYDVVLHVGAPAGPAARPRALDWRANELTLARLEKLLSEDAPEVVAVAGVPNGRLWKELGALRLLPDFGGSGSVGELRRAAEAGAGGDTPVHPEEFWSLEEKLPYFVDLRWSDAGGASFDAVLTRRGEGETRRTKISAPVEKQVGQRPWADYGNTPSGAALAKELEPRLRAHLAERLPDYMVPSAFILLDALPLTPNGKLDARALPEPEALRPELGQDFVAPSTPLEKYLAEKWREVLGLEAVGVHDNFFELGGDSIEAAIVVNRLQEELGEIVHVVAIFDTPTIARFADYLLKNYGAAVERLLGAGTPGAKTEDEAPPRAVVDAESVRRMRELITPLPPRGDAGAGVKNPPAVFVLSPPRSGSTLLRVMLGGHPRLFAPPELELLSFNTLRERSVNYAGRNSFWLEGALRAVMEARPCDAQQARQLVEEFERDGMSVKEFYARLQSWLGGRLLVDKTPSYSLDPSVLRRAEHDFDGARYIHLLRHPLAMIHSFEEARINDIFVRYKHPFSAREAAELIWLISQRNIVEFLRDIPQERRHVIRFERLVADPRREMEQACEFLGVGYDPAMLEVYSERSRRMTDGLHEAGHMLGDVKFHQHRRIEASAGERWRREGEPPVVLSEETWSLAGELGYERPGDPPRAAASAARTLTPVETLPRPSDGRPALFPASFAQERLWFLGRLMPESPFYNLSKALRLSGRLDVEALRRTLSEVTRRHEVLRTSFTEVDGQPMQLVSPSSEPRLALLDLRHLPAAERGAEARRLVTEDSLRAFDLGAGPLLRTTLMRLDEEEHVCVLTMHHIVSDGWSMGVLIREVTALYEAFGRGDAPALEALPFQYADFAVWQKNRLQGEALERQLSYWRRQLAGQPAAQNLPTTYERPQPMSYRGASLPFALTDELSRGLRELSRREGVTLFMTLLAALQALLARYTGQTDISVGTDFAGRGREELSGLIGFFINILVMRTDLSGDPTFRELLARVRETCLGAYAHQELPFDKLVGELRAAQGGRAAPPFQVLFVLQNTPQETLRLPGVTISPVEIESEMTKFDLVVFVGETGRGIAGSWKYSTELFDEEAVARMSGHFITLLESIAAEPDAALSALETRTEEEKRRQAAAQHRREEAKRKRFKGIKPRAVSLPQGELVKTGFLPGAEGFPLVIEPAVADFDLLEWVKDSRAFVEAKLHRHGALLFRGFDVSGAAGLESFAGVLCPELFGDYGDLPREGAGGNVYGSTPYPAEQAILFHNESSHLHRWPMKIWFLCLKAAERGGETPIVDCRKVYDMLDPSLRERFARQGVMYVRNFTDGLDVSWAHFFKTDDRAAVEEVCRRTGVEFEWKGAGGLRTRQVRRAVARHPKTGETVFFNQLQLHHVSCLGADVGAAVRSLFSEEDLPRNVYYGDGSPIEDSVVGEIRDIHDRAAVRFPWQEGDVLMLDNMLAAHARSPYAGARKVVVALGEMMSADGIDRPHAL